MTFPLTFDNLVDADTEDERMTFLLTVLAEAGYPTTDWDPFTPDIAFVRIEARGLANVSQLVAKVARGAYLDSASGDWLTLHAHNRFSVDRTDPVFAVAHARLTCQPGAGPYTLTPGQLWLVATVSGHRYNATNTANVTLGTGSSVELDFKAEQAGADYNLTLADGVALATPLPGVTVALWETTTGSGTCMTVGGVDTEDDASVQRRCRARWATLGLQKTNDAYFFLATTALNADGTAVVGVTKAFVDDTNPRGPGTLDVYLGGAAGGVSEPLRAAVDAYLQPRKAECSDLHVLAATNLPVTFAATVYCEAAKVPVAQAAVATALADYQTALAIGDGAGAGKVSLAKLIELVMFPDGCVDATVTSPGANVVPARGQIAVVTPVLTFVGV